MSEIAEIIDTLENRLSKLLTRLDHLEKTSKDLQQKLQESAAIIQNQSGQIETLRGKYDTLKMANSLLDSDDNKRDTKLKINSLIREIDYCIAQLSD